MQWPYICGMLEVCTAVCSVTLTVIKNLKWRQEGYYLLLWKPYLPVTALSDFWSSKILVKKFWERAGQTSGSWVTVGVDIVLGSILLNSLRRQEVLDDLMFFLWNFCCCDFIFLVAKTKCGGHLFFFVSFFSLYRKVSSIYSWFVWALPEFMAFWCRYGRNMVDVILELNFISLQNCWLITKKNTLTLW